MTKSSGEVVLVHSSDLHVSDEQLPGFYNGLLGLENVLAAARRLQADAVAARRRHVRQRAYFRRRAS